MTAYVALLRGVNVGGHRKLPMATLRAVASGCGFRDVATYIQSGNVVFTASLSAAKVASRLHGAIFAETDIDTQVVVRTAANLAAVVAQNPFLARGADEKLLHVTFLYADAMPTVDAVDPSVYAPDALELVGAHAYLHTPNGMGRSKLANDAMLRKLGLTGTTRNWRTCTTLAEMAASLG